MKPGLSPRRMTAVIISFILIFTLIIPAYAQENETSADDQSSQESGETAEKEMKNPFPKVNLHSQSYIQLNEIQMLPTIDGNLVSFTIDLFNGESRDLMFIDYWVHLKTKSGSEFSVDLIEDDQSKNRISPHTRQNFTFYAKVPNGIKLQDFVIEFIQWDFSMPDYERVLGSISVPENYSPVTPAGKIKGLYVESTKLDTLVEQFQIQGQDDTKKVTIYYTVKNSGARGITLPNYLYYIRTDSGLLYGLDKINGEEETIVQPQDSETFHLQGTIPEGVSSDQWELVLTLKTGQEGGIERPVAFYQLQEQVIEESVVPANETRVLEIDETPVRTWIDEVVKYERDDKWQMTLTFAYENEGNDSMEVPAYQYVIRTSEGIRYPMTGASEAFTIDPRIREEIELRASIPTSVSSAGWELIVEEKEEGSEIAFPLAVYEVPQGEERESEGIPFGEIYEYGNPDGNYAIELKSIQRLPWENQDILSAEIHVHNRDQKSLPIPVIKGWFELDGVPVEQEQVQVVKLDKVLGLQQNSTIRMILYTKIPYTYEYDEVTLVLEEERTDDSETYTTALADFVGQSEQLTLPTVPEGEKLEIETIGNRASIGVRTVHTYTESASRLYYVEVEVENREKRQNTLPNLTGYLRTADGSYFPITIQDTENQVITPSGKALLAVHTQIPYGANTSDVKLVLGEQIETESDSAMVNASEIDLPDEVRRPKSTMEDINIYPYSISFSRFKVNLSEGGNATLSFHYELDKSRHYQILPEGHKLVMEFIDDETPYEQTFEFEQDLKVGSHTGQMTASLNYDSLSEKLSDETNFWVAVYDEYEGYRKLLASRRVLLVESN